MKNEQDSVCDHNEEPPPILSSWKNLYIIVAGNLVALMLLFYLFTKYFE